MNPFQRKQRPRTPLRAEAPQPRTDGQTATLRLYDPIDSWGEFWGVSAKEFTATLDALPADTTEIRLLINSPGGEVWEGIAIMNALRSHNARVVAVVEGIAASAASFIAAAADELQIMENVELFIHRAWGLVMGNAEDMEQAAGEFAHHDRNIASIYAKKAGGDVDQWLAAMSAETFYSAEEAVAAGLADRVVEPSTSGGAEQAKARFDLSVLARTKTTHNSRPAEPAEPNTPNQEGSDMSDTLNSGLRERLGINAETELDDEGLLAAVDEALSEQAEAIPSSESTVPAGAVVLDEATYNALVSGAAAGRAARDEQLLAHREQIVQAAVRDGRIPPARAQHWRDQLKADPGAEQVLAGLQPGLAVPLDEVGFTGGVEESNDDDRLYNRLFPDDSKGA